MEEDAVSAATDEDVLVDFSDPFNNSATSSSNNSNSLNDIQFQQQQYIQQLLMEIEKLRAELDRLHTEVNYYYPSSKVYKVFIYLF